MTGGSVAAQQASDPRVADLVKAGVFRVGLFPPEYVKDEATGELRGVWAETARALAARIGVKAILLEHPTPVKVAECLKAGACDAVVLALAPRFAEIGDFSAPFLQFDYTFLVPAGSTIRSVTDADQPGVRIAAVHDHNSTLALTKLLKQAELVYGEAPNSAFELLRAGRADAFASTRPALMEYLSRLPDSRVLETYYGENLHRVVVQKGHAGRLAYVNEFLDEAKVSGWLQAAIERTGPRGIKVVPKGNSN
jgi:polar amino acid transport system substrate-binding protein